MIQKKKRQKTKEKARNKFDRREIRSELARSARLPKRNNRNRKR